MDFISVFVFLVHFMVSSDDKLIASRLKQY